MHTRNTSSFQSRRKHSLGPVRRAHPASGATWNVQVVRGKITSRCLWHACRALAIGIVLMLLGAGMATIGYYADELSIGREVRGNATVRVKNESRGFHLNNFSYVGPIIMGVGGFIVVAACVMTFEARDSAAKVVPARFKVSTSRTNSNGKSRNSSSRRTTGARWDHHLGVFRTSPACEQPPPPPVQDRQALTAALIHFSKVLGSPSSRSSGRRKPRLSRSGSVPNLSKDHRSNHSLNLESPSSRRCSTHHHSGHHHRHYHQHHSRSSRNSTISCRSMKLGSTDSRLLHPGMLQFHRQALSVDESGPYYRGPNESLTGSKASMAVEVHGISPGSAYILNEISSLKRSDRAKRSDTARRHVLSRQKPVEKEEPHSPRNGIQSMRRRSSTISDASVSSRRLAGRRRASSMSRTASNDSRITPSGNTSSSVVEINNIHSPEKLLNSSPRSPRRNLIAQFSTPSIEKEFRSQLSVCSDPTTMRVLSCQSSIEPCVPEESPEQEEKESINNPTELEKNKSTEKLRRSPIRTSSPTAIIPKPIVASSSVKASPENLRINLKSRPDTLNLIDSKPKQQKFLYRSNSTKSFRKSKPKIINLGNQQFDQIYFIGTQQQDDDNYNSIEVIDERRRKNFIRNNQKTEIIDTENLDETNLIQRNEEISENILKESEASSSSQSNLETVISSENQGDDNNKDIVENVEFLKGDSDDNTVDQENV